jgi:hypothetical protein
MVKIIIPIKMLNDKNTLLSIETLRSMIQDTEWDCCQSNLCQIYRPLVVKIIISIEMLIAKKYVTHHRNT